jgi:hypothetical protein
MSLEDDLLGAFEEHAPQDIRRALQSGVSAVAPISGKRPIDCLIESYMRSSRFAECVRVMLGAGATIGDSFLEALLLDDEQALRTRLDDGDRIDRSFDLLTAYTPCRGVGALHVCAEFNAVRCARTLIAAGADVNARARSDADGLGGQTPIFHTVNSLFNYSSPMMRLLAEAGADLDLRLKGLLWGSGFAWETAVYDVTPMSYAQCGLYAQFHRDEAHVYDNIAYLYERRYGSPLTRRNVPNRYLNPRS